MYPTVFKLNTIVMKKVLQLILFLLCSITFSQSVATYDIVFESYWNASDHSTLPPSPH